MKSKEFINEARVPSDPDVVGYEEKKKQKKDVDIDSVIVTLKGQRSGYFTKLARRFNRAKRIKELLSKEEKKLKDETRDAVEDLFDASDKVYTRVVETASLTFKLAKAETRTKEELDEKGYLKELEQLTGLAVDQLEKIKQKYISTTTVNVDSKVLAPKEKKPKKESVYEESKLKSFVSKIKNHIMNFLSNWDKKFNQLEKNISLYL